MRRLITSIISYYSLKYDLLRTPAHRLDVLPVNANDTIIPERLS